MHTLDRPLGGAMQEITQGVVDRLHGVVPEIDHQEIRLRADGDPADALPASYPPPTPAEADAPEEQAKTRSEADLRGVLTNDSMTEDERKQLDEERAHIEEAAKLRDEDYQLAYAVDILKGLAAVAQAQ